jgi:hypothetical protein
MEILLESLEVGIKQRIDELNETVENPADVVEKIIETQAKIDYLKTVLSKEHYQILLDIDFNYGAQIINTEDIYYRKGLADGMQLQQKINFMRGEGGK